MINFLLRQNNFRPKGTSCDVLCYFGTIDDRFDEIMSNEIDNFNREISWEGMFDLNEARRRILSGMTAYVLMHNGMPCGHVWFRDHEPNRFLFNLFVRNGVEKKHWSGTDFVSYVIGNFERKSDVACEVDEWNVKSLRLFKTLGFEEYIE